MSKKEKKLEPDMIQGEEIQGETTEAIVEEEEAALDSEESLAEELEDGASEEDAVEEDLESGEDESAVPTDGTLFSEELRLEAKLEAIIFASAKPMRASELLEIIEAAEAVLDDDVERPVEREAARGPAIELAHIQEALDCLVETYKNRAGGVQLKYIKRMGYQFQTVKAAAKYMEHMFSSRPRPISRSALETLAIIAYRQPVTRAEIEFIRGVDAGGVFKSLMDRNLIACIGRKEVAGRPMLFGTTDEFLKTFQIGSVKDLPPLESFQVSHEMIAKTNDMIDKAVNEIAVEEFIKDEQYSPEVGADLMADAHAVDEEAEEAEAMNEEVAEEVADETAQAVEIGGEIMAVEAQPPEESLNDA